MNSINRLFNTVCFYCVILFTVLITPFSYSQQNNYIISPGSNIRLVKSVNGSFPMTFSFDSKFLLCSDAVKNVKNRNMEGVINVMDIESGNHLFSLHGHNTFIGEISITKDSKNVFAWNSTHHRLLKWSLKNNTHPIDCTPYNGSIATGKLWLSKDSSYCAWLDSNNRIVLWNIQHKKKGISLDMDFGELLRLTISPSGKYIAGYHKDRSGTSLWDVKTSKMITKIKGHIFSFSSDDTLIAHDGHDGKSIIIKDINRDLVLYNIEGQLGILSWLKILPDKSGLLIGLRTGILNRNKNGNIILKYDFAKRTYKEVLSHIPGIEMQFIFSDDGKYLALYATDNNIKIYKWKH